MKSADHDAGASDPRSGLDAEYLKHRTLQRGAAGWVLLAGLGVAYVISGDFAGWNLGLGLDAEEAAWAGQLARMLGLGPVLAEPASLLDDRQAKLLTVCRALATSGDPLILDEPAAGLDSGDVRLVARVVGVGLRGRRLVVVTADPVGHRSFVSRAQARS